MKLSQYFGTQILEKHKKNGGYILGISCLNDEIDGYICCDESDNEFFVAAKDAKLSGGKLQYTNAVKKRKKCAKLRLGYPLYSEDGKFLGHVADFTLKGNKITFAHANGKRYDFSRLTLGDVAILKNGLSQAANAAKDMLISNLLSE